MKASLSYTVRVTGGWMRFVIVASGVGIYNLLTSKGDVFYPGIHAFGNMWDVLFRTVSPRPFVLLWAPLFILLILRNFWSPCEVPVLTRVRRRDQWWLGAIVGEGVQALVYVTGIMVVTLVFAAIAFGVSWHWSSLDYYRAPASSSLMLVIAMPPVSGTEPALVALASWALLVLGLWCIGALSSMLALWWKIPWLGMGTTLLMMISSVLPTQILFYILPGSQFVIGRYVNSAGQIVGVFWPVLYGSLVLMASVIVGLKLADNITWS